MWLPAAVALAFLVQTPDYSAEGLKALESREYEAAARSFARAVEADPKDYAAHFHLALAQSLLNRDPEAIAGYRKVLELKPGLYEAQLNLGILLVRHGQAKEAIPQLEAVAAARPKDARPRVYLGDALLDEGDAARARETYQAAAEIDTKSAAAILGMARAEARLGRLTEAEPLYRKAAELDPAYKQFVLELAGMFEKAKQLEPAIAIYKGFPENPAARERLGELLMETGHAAEAVPELEEAVRKSPTVANRVALAMAYRRASDLDRATSTMEEAVKLEPANPDLRLMYGRLLRDQKKYLPAAREFNTVVKARPDSVEALNELAGMLVALGNYPEGLAALDRLKTLGAEIPGHLYLRAIMLDKMRDLKGALANYQAFLAQSQGKHPDEEFKARQRARIVERELSKR